MRVHFGYVQEALLHEYETSYVRIANESLQKSDGGADLRIEADPAKSDLIILWESVVCKSLDYIAVLENDPLIQEHAERVFCVNYEDHPEGILAGLYTSLEHPFFDRAIHVNRPFLLVHNSLIHSLAHEEVTKPFNARWLFSFTGPASHPVRRLIFKLFAEPSPAWQVRHFQKLHNHNDDDRREFLKTGLQSLFCLCPRGNCSYTHCITEAMAMARVPVIIADDWVPFSFEEKIPYYIKVREEDVAWLPDILAARRNDAEEYRQNARFLWEKYCSVGNRFVSTVECFAKMAERNDEGRSYAAYQERWHSKTFLENAGWTLRQQFALRMEQRARRWFPSIRMPGVSNLMRYRTYLNALDLIR